MSERKVGIVRAFMEDGSVKTSGILFSNTRRKEAFKNALALEGVTEVRLHTMSRFLYSSGAKDRYGWDYPTFYALSDQEKTWKKSEETPAKS